MMAISSNKTTETILGIAIAVVSFLAGQVWSLLKTLYRERKLKRALQTEIEEAPPCILRNLEALKCMIQLSCLYELANYGPVSIPVHVHAEHFPEINLKLTKAERTSINAIYHLIYQLNADFKKITELGPTCGNDPLKLRQLMMMLDTAYRNSYHVLLLIRLHLDHIEDLEHITTTNETDGLIHSLRAQNDAELLKLGAEAKKEGSAAIRQKYQDGAVSVAEIASTPPPQPGHFYFDVSGTKYKCIEVRNDIVTWFQLESQLGALTVDAVVQQPIASVRHCYEITDSDEKSRLERRCAQLENED